MISLVPLAEQQGPAQVALEEAHRRFQQGLAPWQWFDQRHASHGHQIAQTGEGYEGESAWSHWRQRMQHPSSQRPRAIYVHIPFCTRICSFCSFYRMASDLPLRHAYYKALLLQIQRLSTLPWVQEGRPFSAVFFGGGTPTALAACELADLIQTIRQRFPLEDQAEISVESRFDGVDHAAIDTLIGAGVNRLSFGVQTFDSEIRRSNGRIADQSTIGELLNGIADRALINCDLIANLPGQSLDAWHRDFAILAQTPATSVSVYALNPRPKSALVQRIRTGKQPPLPGLDFEWRLHEITTQAMRERRSWRRINFHHYGDRLREEHRYGQVRWGGMDTLALGCGSGGRIDNFSYAPQRDVTTFCQAAEKEEHDCCSLSLLNPAIMQRLTLRSLVEGEGISYRECQEILPALANRVPMLCDMQMLECHGKEQWLSLSDTGAFWGYALLELIQECASTGAADRMIR